MEMPTADNVTGEGGRLTARYYYRDPEDRGLVVLDGVTGKFCTGGTTGRRNNMMESIRSRKWSVSCGE
uniref:Uncharacterized protein n=1 Tax=Faecalibaculum rodentium TaxID=1702221 RepID=A0A140DVC6_9FIRM|nr:hypothetical protein AALO17_14690 [Faecalibaculum rodentium]